MTSLKNHNFSKTPVVFPIFLRQFHVLRLTLEAGRRRKANATLRDGPGSVAAVLRLLAWPSKVGEITGGIYSMCILLVGGFNPPEK